MICRLIDSIITYTNRFPKGEQFWSYLHQLIPVIQKAQQREKILGKVLADHVPDNKVLSGPFQDLQYPSLNSAGSALGPKLLGTYEKELHVVVDELLKCDFDILIDVGAAEGYYSTGFALKNKKLQVLSFDIDMRANELAKAMARCNQVEDRVQVKQEFTVNALRDLGTQGNILLICDCEGYENELFTDQTISACVSLTVLVETHDFIEKGTTERLRTLFESTHCIEEISAVARTFNDFPVPTKLDSGDQLTAMNEYRPNGMKWLYIKPLSVEKGVCLYNEKLD